MMKECVILNGKIINFGPWDYQIQSFEIEPPQYNDNGDVIKEGVYEDRPTNPLPDGSTIEQRDVEYDVDRGWYEVGTLSAPTLEQRLQATEDMLLTMMLGGM